jgi:hypothetical protein
MKPTSVAMPDGSHHLLRRLLSPPNHKQRKGQGYRSVGLTLTPRATGRSGRNLCPHATRGCSRGCFADADRMAWPQNKRAAVARTRLLANNPDLFFAMLSADLKREERAALRRGVPLVCRLNVVSDVPFEREFPALFLAFPDVQFMDYTKDPSRVLDPARPGNYHLTFSRSERNEEDCLRVLAAGGNVTVVFRKPPFPETFWGYAVVDGDRDDLRFLDPSPRVIALKAKGKACRADTTGFVIDHPPRVNSVLVRPAAEDGGAIPLPVVSISDVGQHEGMNRQPSPEPKKEQEIMPEPKLNGEPRPDGDRYRPRAGAAQPRDGQPRTAGPAAVADDAIPPLSEADQRHLQDYQKKMQLVCDRAVGVARGRMTGLYLYGPGGIGKSHNVIGTLRETNTNYRLHNSRMDGRGLFTALERDPDAVHVLEDCEQMMRNRNVRGLLRSALWGQRDGSGPMERVVTWPLGGGKRELRCHFDGGIIIVANLPPADIPEMEAVTTRIPVIHLTASDAEVRAMMRQMAREGYEDAGGNCLTPGECLAVAEHVIEQCQGLDRTLDLRLLLNSYEDYLQWSENESGLHWRDLVGTRVRQRPAGIRLPVDVAAIGSSRATADARQKADLDIAREIAAATKDPEQRLAMWVARTGKSRATLYRRLSELDG